MTAVQALLHGAIDYAGLFPPAGLDLETTVRNYAQYRAGRDRGALGRLVMPAGKLAEFAGRWPQYVVEWPISLLPGSDYDTEMRLAVDVGLRLDVVECRPARLQDIAEIRRRMPSGGLLFAESPQGCALQDLITAAAGAGACAKVRTGGVVAEAIPSSSTVAAFLVACAQHDVRLKATAGLHHALRGERRLTYEPRSATAPMHGFVNFFIAAMAAYEGANEPVIAEILNDGERRSFDSNADGLQWRGRIFSSEVVKEVRDRFAISFGSCSFEEPMQEMRAMGWIE
ncbi:MAG TPA: hypothetical protein VN734_14050 [Acidobacteriaceae bacterium]|nr:hypothetical protein [Acidobacteriaceae bacterium]